MFKLIERRADSIQQEDIYEGPSGQTISAIYPKDKRGLIDIYRIKLTLVKQDKTIKQFTTNRHYILTNTNHAEMQNFSVDHMYHFLINLNRSQQGHSRKTLTKVLYELLEEMHKKQQL